jgi:ketosteroid isomerase-like protein
MRAKCASPLSWGDSSGPGREPTSGRYWAGMSQKNVEWMRQFGEAWSRGDLETVDKHPRDRVDHHRAFLEAATYRGHEEVRSYLGSMLNEFENLRVVPEELIEAGDQA